MLAELREAGADVPVVVGGIIPPADEAALLEAGVARVYTPKDFEVSRIMGDIVDLVAAQNGVVAAPSRYVTPPCAAPWDAAIAVKNEAQHVTATSGPFRVELPLDVEIAALADRQHGVVALRQLRELGLSARAVSHRAARGRLHRIHRGIYAVGRSKLTGYGQWMAAVLACGPRAALSHRSGAGLWGVRPDNRPKSDVSVPSPSARARQGIEVHRQLDAHRR